MGVAHRDLRRAARVYRQRRGLDWGELIGFLQPILIPVAIAAILAYLLDPVVTYLSRRGFGRTRAVLSIFPHHLPRHRRADRMDRADDFRAKRQSGAPIAFLYRTHVRDQVVDLIYRYEHTFGLGAKAEKTGAATASSTGSWPSQRRLRARLRPNRFPSRAPRRFQVTVKSFGPAPTKLTSADRQRIQDWVQKQLPALEKQLPDLIAKLWSLVKTSIGGFLGVTGFLLSLVMVPIYSFFLLKERPGDRTPLAGISAAAQFSTQRRSRDHALADQQLHHRLLSRSASRLPR